MLNINNKCRSFFVFIKALILFGIFFLSFPVIAHQSPAIQLEIHGIENSDVLNNAKIYTKMIVSAEMDGSERNQYLVRQAIERAVSVFGYYNTKITFKFQSKKDNKNHNVLIANVDLGKPSYIAGINVNFNGESKDDKSFQLLKKKTPKIGEIVLQQTYDDYKSNVSQLALEKGYFDGEFIVSQLAVSPDTHKAWWDLNFNSGARYHFGQFKFIHNQIREDYLRNVMTMKSGDPYLIDQLSNLTNEYSQSGWFSSVLFQPKLNKKDKLVDMDIFLIPRKKNQFNIGVGYSTDVGTRFRFGWKRPWINDRGHSLRSNLYFSKVKTALGASYKIPLLQNPLKYYYDIGLGMEKEKENDTDTTAVLFSALRYWNKPTGWQYALGVRSRYDSFTQADQSHNTKLIYPTLSFNRTRFRGGLFPYWGDTQQLNFDYGTQYLLSDINFFKVKATSIWIRTYAQNNRVILRGEVGYLKTNKFEKIPPSLRFFAGGARSIRGYGYKKISPKDSQGKLVGGSRLANLSLEYQYQVYPKWWLATFIDSGLAANKFSTENLRYGSGIGVRWVLPIGPIKLDIATPIHSKEDKKNIQFYLGIGSEF